MFKNFTLNVKIERERCGCEKLFAKIGFDQKCVKNLVKCNQRQEIVSKFDTNSKTLELNYHNMCIVD